MPEAPRSAPFPPQDLALVAIIGYLGLQLYNAEVPLWGKVLLWPVYWYAQVRRRDSAGWLARGPPTPPTLSHPLRAFSLSHRAVS